MEKRDRAFVHRISKYANLKNWKDFLNIIEIEDEAYGKRGWKVSRFSYGGGRGRAFVHRISKYANLKNWKDFLNITGIEDEAYGKMRLETVKIFVYSERFS